MIAVLHFTNGKVVELDESRSSELKSFLKNPGIATDTIQIEYLNQIYFLRHVYCIEWKGRRTPPVVID